MSDTLSGGFNLVRFGPGITVNQLDPRTVGVGLPPPSEEEEVIPVFALTGGPFFFTGSDTPAVLDGEWLSGGGASLDFYTNDSTAFAKNSAGRAEILRSGMYVISCQAQASVSGTVGDTTIGLQLQYGSGGGYSIEVPWLGPGPYPLGEQILGSVLAVPADIYSDVDFGLQRLHPYSLTSAFDFPEEIQPTIEAWDYTGFGVSWLGLWGYRISDALDNTHSN